MLIIMNSNYMICTKTCILAYGNCYVGEGYNYCCIKKNSFNKHTFDNIVLNNYRCSFDTLFSCHSFSSHHIFSRLGFLCKTVICSDCIPVGMFQSISGLGRFQCPVSNGYFRVDLL